MQEEKLYSEIFELTSVELADGAVVKTSATTTVELPPASSPLTVEMKELLPEELPETAWATTTTSTVWQIDIKRRCVESPSTPLALRSGNNVVPEPVEGLPCGETWHPTPYLTLTLPAQGPFYFKKVIYFWDGNKRVWRPLPTETDFNTKTVSARYPLPYGRFIVRDHTSIYEGIASWYKWKNGNFAAFRHLPKRTTLKVTNISGSARHNKSVTVRVNDYGPEEWTGRLIDLDYYAYRQIGIPRGGVMPVRVEIIK